MSSNIQNVCQQPTDISQQTVSSQGYNIVYDNSKVLSLQKSTNMAYYCKIAQISFYKY